MKKAQNYPKKVSGNSGASLCELVVNVCFFLSTAGGPDRKLELLKVRLHFYDLFTVASPRPGASIPALKVAFALKSFFLKVDVQVFVSCSTSSSDNLRRRCDYMTEEQGCQRFHSSQDSRGSPLSRRTFSYFV